MCTFNVGELSQKTLLASGVETWFAAETSSTNTIAKDDASSVSSPLKVYLATHQNAGRGRNQNTWSDLGSGSVLLSSWSFSFKKNPQPILAPLVGLAVYQNLVRCFSGLQFSLKAPNDILVGSEKLCGILIENILTGSQGRSVIGIGLNVFSSPSSLTATHLSAHCEVNEKNWAQFLGGLAGDLTIAMKNAEQENLTPDTCKDLLSALEKNPLLDDSLKEVTPQGSLIFKNKKIDWQTL